MASPPASPCLSGSPDAVLDAVRPTDITFPSLLEFPQPKLRAYSRENSIADKFEAMTKLGMANTRMKDYFDLWHLARTFAFDGIELVETIRATFERRARHLLLVRVESLLPRAGLGLELGLGQG